MQTKWTPDESLLALRGASSLQSQYSPVFRRLDKFRDLLNKPRFTQSSWSGYEICHESRNSVLLNGILFNGAMWFTTWYCCMLNVRIFQNSAIGQLIIVEFYRYIPVKWLVMLIFGTRIKHNNTVV